MSDEQLDLSIFCEETGIPEYELADEICYLLANNSELRRVVLAMLGELTFSDYHEGVLNTLKTTDDPVRDIDHMAFGLCEEAGEAAGKLKRLKRGDLDSFQVKEALHKEIGDVLWYCDSLAHLTGTTLADIAKANLEKLASRKARGVLAGSGDDR